MSPPSASDNNAAAEAVGEPSSARRNEDKDASPSPPAIRNNHHPHPHHASSANLTKKEKGRLKKLLKKASMVHESRPVSGVARASDWHELQRLLQQQQGSASPTTNSSSQTPRPRIGWREGRPRRTTTDAVAHRDLLLRLLLQSWKATSTSSSAGDDEDNNSENGRHKKRKRQQEPQASNNNNSFGWASLHNPAAVSSVGVVEIDVVVAMDRHRPADNEAAAVDWLRQRLAGRVLRHRRHVLVAPTAWFQESCVYPRSVSEALLYCNRKQQEQEEEEESAFAEQSAKKKKVDSGQPPTSRNSSKKKEVNSSSGSSSDTATSLEDLVALLEPLVLTRAQLENHGYPLPAVVPAAVTPKEDDAETKNKCPCNNEEFDDHHHQQQQPLLPPVRPQDISLPEASLWVRDYQQTPQGTDPQNQLPPYVMRPPQQQPPNNVRQIFAMDAEMVETSQGKELARVTLCRLVAAEKSSVDSDDDDLLPEQTTATKEELVFDVLVRPRNAVVNYWTQYSGVTAAMLNNKDCKNNNIPVVQLEQVQAALLRTIGPNDIVIGHSLENDLRATRWMHLAVVDTAVLFADGRRRKLSLRHLAAVLLNQRIQQNSNVDTTNGTAAGGHCSQEDAITALRLAVRRAVQGPSFGIRHDNNSSINWLAQFSTQKTTTTMTTAVGPVVAIGPSAWLQRHVLAASHPNSIHALQCETVHDHNAKALESWLRTASPQRRASVVWAKFGLRQQQQRVGNTSENQSAESSDPSSSSLSYFDAQDMEKMEARLDSLLSKLPPQAVLLIAIQPGFQRAEKLTQTRKIRCNPKATLGWSDAEEDQWRGAVQACRKGFVLWVSGGE